MDFILSESLPEKNPTPKEVPQAREANHATQQSNSLPASQSATPTPAPAPQSASPVPQSATLAPGPQPAAPARAPQPAPFPDDYEDGGDDLGDDRAVTTNLARRFETVAGAPNCSYKGRFAALVEFVSQVADVESTTLDPGSKA